MWEIPSRPSVAVGLELEADGITECLSRYQAIVGRHLLVCGVVPPEVSIRDVSRSFCQLHVAVNPVVDGAHTAMKSRRPLRWEAGQVVYALLPVQGFRQQHRGIARPMVRVVTLSLMFAMAPEEVHKLGLRIIDRDRRAIGATAALLTLILLPPVLANAFATAVLAIVLLPPVRTAFVITARHSWDRFL